ncbi:hypothetical protein [Anaerocolumna xylanovorans]|uniref:hypothetical protein n=1 Tax=Anaerocolumna xylanovorans TaxID=100134 RepID=UPI0009FC859F|nr:hypothetical protein [Anaerocolumna xylanovorans]
MRIKVANIRYETLKRVGSGVITPKRLVKFGNKETINKKAFKKFKSAMYCTKTGLFFFIYPTFYVFTSYTIMNNGELLSKTNTIPEA